MNPAAAATPVCHTCRRVTYGFAVQCRNGRERLSGTQFSHRWCEAEGAGQVSS